MVNCYRPESLKEALYIRKNNRTILLAGGTDLMVKNKNWAGLLPEFEKDVLLIGHLKELRNIEYKDNYFEIGSACTISDIIGNKAIPGFMKNILKNMASPAIRNIATIGGNICNSSPAGDTLPILYALNAELVLENANGERRINIEDFINGPGKNHLGGDEILKEILFQVKDFNHIFYKKIGARKANAISKASFLGLSLIEDKKIRDIRISIGAVAKTVIRSRETEKSLKGLTVGEIENKFIEVKKAYSNLINSIDDQRSSKEYRDEVSIKLLEKFLTEELGMFK